MTLRHRQSVKSILFDLDGTLLSIEMEAYIDGYIDGLARCFEDMVDRLVFTEVLLDSAIALLNADDGGQTNEEHFLALVTRQLGISRTQLHQRLELFYRTRLDALAPLVKPFPLSRRILRRCFERGFQVALATNPVFPRPVIDARLRWAGLDDFPYHLISSYENSHFCKPHPRFFRNILTILNISAHEAIMVGNDTRYDLAAQQAGIATFLVDTCLIDRDGLSHTAAFRGNHANLLDFIEHLDKGRSD
jgi:FMN phosphatase YigB (HAD superfamily)